MAAVKILKTWHLKTTDGRAVYQDFQATQLLKRARIHLSYSSKGNQRKANKL
jgi:hypothetical protein